MKKSFFLLFLIWQSITLAQVVSVIESTEKYLIVNVDFSGCYTVKDTTINGSLFQIIKGKENTIRLTGEPWLPVYNLNLGILPEASPKVALINSNVEKIQNVFIVPYPEEDTVLNLYAPPQFNIEIYNKDLYYPVVEYNKPIINSFRYCNIATVGINPYQFNPVKRELHFNKKITLRIDYNSSLTQQAIQSVDDNFTKKYLKSNTINYPVAQKWIGTSPSLKKINAASDTSWFDPNKTYYKIFVSKKDIYRISYDYLNDNNIYPGTSISKNNIELYSDSGMIPIEITDTDKDGYFNSGDFIQFVGYPPEPSPYTHLNLYNYSNVYWLSFEAKDEGLKYHYQDGYPTTYDTTVYSSLHTIHYERDTIYERLGYAPDDKRDYWFWGKVSGNNGSFSDVFSYPFPTPKGLSVDTKELTLRVNMHGMTKNDNFNLDHKVEILFTGQPIDTFYWDGQDIGEFEAKINLNKIGLWDVNYLQAVSKGINPGSITLPTSDEVRFNWFEIEYLREHRVDTNYFNFISSPNLTGKLRFDVYRWKANNMKVFVPEKNKIIINPWVTNDPYEEVLFADSISEQTEYFCAANNYFSIPDSIIPAMKSNLHDITNRADYIIITHPNFRQAAERLAEYRSKNLEDFTSPTVKIVDINEIYNEFSAGLNDPFALQKFLKYAFDNWQKPAPSYVVLFGDMSWDYRKIFPDSRPNFIPSIPYHSIKYGQAVSDNMIACIIGDDALPDLAIGRLSAETIDEANALVDKIIAYPADDAKPWKENVLLIGAGESLNDENVFHFNDESVYLENAFLKPNGFPATKVFRYPSDEYQEFFGERPEVRQAFNSGCVVANFYGHGGGYQWDFVFLNDDIYLLQNGNKLPLILSITCYTAHFDNQNVFGEQFSKVPGKGCIGFIGSTGLTTWQPGVDLNIKFFNQLFRVGVQEVGPAFMFAKNSYGMVSGYTRDMVCLANYLGDPALKLALPDKPDFTIASSSITINPDYPVLEDTVTIKLNIENFGKAFLGDTVTVRVSAVYTDTNYVIGTVRLENFGQKDSVFISWIPKKAGLVTLKADINTIDKIDEIDESDNIAENSFTVFSINEPNVIRPINGLSSNTGIIKFQFADIGYYISKSFNYFIEIDTSLSFSNPVIKTSALESNEGIVEWSSPELSKGVYFWRARMLDGQQYSKWTAIQTFSVTETIKSGGYFASEKQLQLFQLNNVLYSDSTKSLLLNTALLPPKPSRQKFLENIALKVPDSIKGLSAITTDGNYIYIGHMAYYGGQTKIYKIGTGFRGTEKGKVYGTISNYPVSIWHQIFFYPDGNIYIPYGSAHHLLKMDTATGDTSIIEIEDGLLNATNSKVQDGAFFITTDGNLVYNLAYIDSLGNRKYTIRVFDPKQNWKKIRDIQASGESYLGFTSFFATKDYIYPYENNIDGLIRKIAVSDGEFIDEWLSNSPYQGYYAWCYDYFNDLVYASVFRTGMQPKISKFAGHYKQSTGSITTQEVGPVSEWKNISYAIDSKGSTGKWTNNLQVYNSTTKLWDTIRTDIPANFVVDTLDAVKFPKLRMHFSFTDSSFGSAEPIKLKEFGVEYTDLPEISLFNKDLEFTPDSIMQGFPITMKFKIKNYGYNKAENLKINFYMDNADSAFYKKTINLQPDSTEDISYTFSTNNIVLKHKVKVSAVLQKAERFTFNNLAYNNFYITRDSINPVFSIQFDGIEILDGDIVSSRPQISMTLKDNSPLPLSDTSRFFIFLDSETIGFKKDSIKFSYTEYPNSQANLEWNPTLSNGTHILEVLAKDASGNFFDSVAYSTSFLVSDKDDLYDVYNYPNPFKDDTYFTFNLTGEQLPDRFSIKIFTVTGRLIKEIEVDNSKLQFGFNKVYWDGKDEDGSTLANGVYFYKIICQNKNFLKTIIQKLAKVK
ncbi:MAG: T9SS C-terminal target domain-containing protein [Ignavibacteriales bacterium]|nr:MAG: T9SS C-terminal target domain-containing protein [Ignavibacteriales bacterium]